MSHAHVLTNKRENGVESGLKLTKRRKGLESGLKLTERKIMALEAIKFIFLL
jgi:hypothetical protein